MQDLPSLNLSKNCSLKMCAHFPGKCKELPLPNFSASSRKFSNRKCAQQSPTSRIKPLSTWTWAQQCVSSKLQLEEFVFQPHQLQKGVSYFVEVELWCQMAIRCWLVASRNQEASSIEKLNKLWKIPNEEIFENNLITCVFLLNQNYFKPI